MARFRSSMRMGALNLLVLVIAISLAVLSVLSLVTAQASDRLANRHADTTNEIYAAESAGQFFLREIDYRLDVARGADYTVSGLVSVLSESVGYMATDAAEIVSTDGIEVSGSAACISVDTLYSEMGASVDGGVNDGNAVVIEPDATPMSNSDGAPGRIDGDQGEAEHRSSASDDSSDSVSENIYREIVVLEEIDADRSDALVIDASKSAYTGALTTYLGASICGISADFSVASGRNLHCVIAIGDDLTYKVLSWKITKNWPDDAQNESLWLG